METSIVVKTFEDLTWEFESNKASIVCGEHKGFSHRADVDPFPGYAHDIQTVRAQVGQLKYKFPITWPVTFYILPYEVMSRTNAYAQAENWDYDNKISDGEGEEQYSRHPYIVFSGKRIPPMPSMTRYLVAHEYGHIVQDWIAVQRKQKSHELLNEYASMRKVSAPKSYGGGWHLTPGEIFANDFRVLVTGQETEFWPHVCPRPHEAPQVINWWAEAHELVSCAEEG